MENLLELKKGYLPTNHAWNMTKGADRLIFKRADGDGHFGINFTNGVGYPRFENVDGKRSYLAEWFEVSNTDAQEILSNFFLQFICKGEKNVFIGGRYVDLSKVSFAMGRKLYVRGLDRFCIADTGDDLIPVMTDGNWEDVSFDDPNEPNVGDICKFTGDLDECHIGVLTDIDNSAIFKYRSNTSEWCMDAEKITDPNIIKLFSNNG